MLKKTDKRKVSKSTISRLFVYLREVSKLANLNIRTISSAELAERVNLGAAQIRKDLGYFGHFGVSGSGYDIKELERALKRILEKNKNCRVAIVGCGNLGTALISYGGFQKQGVEIAAAFDTDPKKIGKKYGGIPVQPLDKMPGAIKAKKITIGIITVPAQNAREAVDCLVDSGIKCILNFAPVGLMVPEDVTVKDVDLSREIETLSYFVDNNVVG
ncbi:MAG: redox-sensing transcriptional repressor Rex [Candidatus Omnitrophica bacterium]|nr:redox-sensing transcriptional repressor Rex [Candidatus Omnitrophota bacterium]MBU1128209.1 redox-sensing transcriptional repressor Rex [Candidatus Omnitrophota bacterium]MBU1784563.1 redox-sensing transcriptional repressor Rex [Candidatus Omnitrophota bacterium]MBU1851672.1 redox-sensing transcriptional repressor Rex [Candidatus Omnitrophota bacterium]